jgi:hypothetical protein
MTDRCPTCKSRFWYIAKIVAWFEGKPVYCRNEFHDKNGRGFPPKS